MNNLIIPETNYTPRIDFKSNGDLTIIGKSLPEDTALFYEPIVKWIADCTAEKITLTVRLDYMNSSSAHQVTKILMTLKDNPAIKECLVDWHYEADDEDSLDFGKELEYLTDFNFRFYQYEEAEM